MTSENIPAPNTCLSLEDLQKRIFKEFLDVIILGELKENVTLSGYDLAVLQQRKFSIALSPGTVYATLYMLERRGLIKGYNNSRKTTFTLTIAGEKAYENLKNITNEFSEFMKCLFPRVNVNQP
jgi:DNA-binding PadR family transcriptional regulator